MEQKRNFKRRAVCAQDIPWHSFASHSRSNNILLETGFKVDCEICKLVLNSGADYDHLFAD